MSKVCIFSQNTDLEKEVALQQRLFKSSYHLPLITNPNDLGLHRYALIYRSNGLNLEPIDKSLGGAITVEFESGVLDHRRKFGGGKNQALSKAVGLHQKRGLNILDATAGLGRDAFILAALGADLTLFERNPVVSELLKDGLGRAMSGDCPELKGIISRMRFLENDSNEVLKHTAIDELWDVIYLDPMFPHIKQKALGKKEMRFFQELIGEDVNNEQLLDLALDHVKYRVVVKRPIKAPFFNSLEPTYSLSGKVNRFDIYVNHSISKE